jgi:phage terminase Nu1 subunit (DNA packaging protein)
MPILKPIDDFIVPGAVLEEILGVGNKTVRRLAADGHAVKSGTNSYALRASLKLIIAKKDAEIVALRDDENPELSAAKLRLIQAQIEGVESKNRKAAGELIAKVDIAPAWSRVVLALRSALLQLPPKAKKKIPRLTVKDQKILDTLVRQALTDAGLTKTSPAIGGISDEEPEDD